jgi:hypothetical protein
MTRHVMMIALGSGSTHAHKRLLHSRSTLRGARLVLEAAARSATASLLELATLVLGVWLCVTVSCARRRSEVSVGLARVTRARQKNAALALGRAERQLVEGQDLTAGLEDAGARSLGDAQCDQAQLGHVVQTHVVGDGADHDARLLGARLVLHLASKSCKRDWGLVDLAHEQTPQYDLVELGARSSCQESIQLDQQQKIDVVASRGLSSHFAIILVLDIDTLFANSRRVARG